MNPYYDQFKYLVEGSGGGEDIGDVYKGVLYQRGYGLDSEMHGLGFADGLMRMFKFVLPALKTGLQYLGKQGVSTAANIASDAISGKNVSESIKEHVTGAAEDLFAKAPDALSSVIRGGQKRKRASVLEGVEPDGYQQPPRVKRRKLRKNYSSSRKIGRGLLSTYPVLAKIE
jgi:hypothetical protein